MFDAMHLKPHYEYNVFSDRVVGLEAINNERDSREAAQCLLVFMIRSIFHGWTQIIGHHFTKAAFSKEDLKKLIEEYLIALDNASLSCRAIVCDQEPSHVSLFRLAGCNRDKPSIRCPSSGRQIYVIYDPPHLMKSARNNLLTSDFLVSVLLDFACTVLNIYARKM